MDVSAVHDTCRRHGRRHPRRGSPVQLDPGARVELRAVPILRMGEGARDARRASRPTNTQPMTDDRVRHSPLPRFSDPLSATGGSLAI